MINNQNCSTCVNFDIHNKMCWKETMKGFIDLYQIEGKAVDYSCVAWEEFKPLGVCEIRQKQCGWREEHICRKPRAASCPYLMEEMNRREKKNEILSGADMIIVRDSENREVAEITEDRIVEMNGGKVFWHGKKG